MCHALSFLALFLSFSPSLPLPLPNSAIQFISEIIVGVIAEKHAADFGPESQAAMRKALELFRNDMASKYKELGFQG